MMIVMMIVIVIMIMNDFIKRKEQNILEIDNLQNLQNDHNTMTNPE